MAKTETAEATYLSFPIDGSIGKGLFTIVGKCQHNENEKGRKCHVDKCLLEIQHSKNLTEEQHQGKHLVIYDRAKHGPLKYETEN